MFMSTFATNISEIKRYLQAQFVRLQDRGFSPNIKKDLEDEDDDTPNTKLKI